GLGVGDDEHAAPHALARRARDRAGRLGARVPRRPASGRILRREARTPGLPRVAPDGAAGACPPAGGQRRGTQTLLVASGFSLPQPGRTARRHEAAPRRPGAPGRARAVARRKRGPPRAFRDGPLRDVLEAARSEAAGRPSSSTLPPGAGLPPRRAPLGGRALGRAPLRGGALGGAPLGGRALGGAPLRGAALGGAPLRGAALGGAPLRGAALGGAPLRGAALGGAPLRCRALGG